MSATYQLAVERSGIFEALAAYDPHIAGTLPLGISVATSDIDVICHFSDPASFTNTIIAAYQMAEGFTIKQWRSGKRPVIATFQMSGWVFEIYGETTAVEDQPAWRHFQVEKRLLQLGGPDFRQAVIEARQQGLKTELAFAAVLHLPDNAYEQLLQLAQQTDEILLRVLEQTGFHTQRFTVQSTPIRATD